MTLWGGWRRSAVVLAVVGSLLAPVPSVGASGAPGAAVGAAAVVQPSKGPVWSGSELQAAVALGDIAAQSDPVFRRTRMEDVGGAAASVGDWRDYCFELSGSRKVGLGLRQLDHDADLYLLSGGGAELASDSTAGTASEWVEVSLRAGSYCARVVAVEAGENRFVFRYGVGPADPDSLLPEPAPAPAPDPDTGSDPGSDTESDTESDSESDTGSGSGTDSETDTESESDAESDPVSGAVPGVLWSASLVVGEGDLRGDPAFGYSVHTALGSLDSTVLSDGKTVYYLAHVPALGELYLGVSPRLDDEASLVLSVGGVDFAVADASVSELYNWHYVWAADGIDWTAGDDVEVSLRDADPAPGELSNLAVTGVSGVEFDPSQHRYDAQADDDAAAVTVAPAAPAGTSTRVLTVRAQGELRFDPADADVDSDGHQAALSGSGDTLVVAATDDGTTQRAYVVRIAPSPATTPTTPPPATTPPAATPSSPPASSQPAPAGASTATVRGSVLSGMSTAGARGHAVAGAFSAAVGTRKASPAAASTPSATTPPGASTASVRGASESVPGGSVQRSDDASRQDATLASLSASDTLSQTTDDDGIPVTATVAAATSRVTVTAATAHSEASYTITPADADTDTDGHQVDLLEPQSGGAPTQTAIVIAVRSADSQVLQSYTLTVIRQAPPPIVALQDSDPPARETGFIDIDVGMFHACAIRVGGQVVCWRLNPDTRSGASFTPHDSPSTPGPYVDVTAGQYSACGVLADGTAHCWDGPDQVPEVPSGNITAVSQFGGYGFGPWCSLGSDGAGRCRNERWSKAQGRYWHDDDFDGALFQELHAGEDDTACGLTTGGTIRCSRLGTALQAPSGTFTSIGYGGLRGCGIRAEGTLKGTLECWGHSSPSLTDEVPSPPAGVFTQVDSGDAQTCAVRSDGNAECWRNLPRYSRNWLDVNYHMVVEGPFQKVSVDKAYYACGLKTDGSIKCWSSHASPPWFLRLAPLPPVVDDETRLEALSLMGRGADVGLSFDPGTASYSVDVANAVATVTVDADTFGVYAEAVVSPADSDLTTDGHQVALTAGATTTITVTVTAQDDVNTRVYTVAVARAS